MASLSNLVSEDSRPLLARVRRCRLHQIADGEGIPYPAGASKEVMLPILSTLEPAVINKYITFQQVMQKDEQGNQHIEAYPVDPEHYSAKNQDQVAAALMQRTSIEAEEQEKIRFDKERLTALENENNELKKLINERLSKLETHASLPLESLLPWQLKRLAKDAGIDYKDLSKEEMIAALEA